MTNTSSVSSDDAFVEGIRAMPASDRVDALLDVALDTATWQAAEDAAAKGRAR